MHSARSQQKTLIVPDKDADGLSAGAILRHTLMLLGLPPEMIDVHLLSKGNTIHSEGEREIMKAYSPQFIFVLDQGSRPGPPVIDGDHNALIIDHHYATEDDFPKDSLHVTACNSPPVATSSLLTYLLCEPLHDRVAEVCDWLCVVSTVSSKDGRSLTDILYLSIQVGTHADLGNTIKWESPFPDMKECLKKYTKKVLNDVVSLINAPRRTPARDVRSAWDALCDTLDPRSILKNPKLISARQAIGDEVERCTHAAPKFSPDGKVALFRIRSEFQVHPMIATRWAGHLQSKNLEVVIVANEGYLADKVNFSCRIPRCARNRDPPVDIISQLKAFASLKGPPGEDQPDVERLPLLERLGDDFARGHVQASGGIVGNEEFEELVRNMQIGVKPPPKPISQESSPAKGKKVIDAGQKNNLLDFFGPKRQAPKAESS